MSSAANKHVAEVGAKVSRLPSAVTPPYAGRLLRHATLRQLQVFEAIVRLGSFTRAAEALFLTQPTVSMQIRKLKSAVGLPLFEQIGRNIKLTEAGRELYEVCINVFSMFDSLEMRIDDLKGMKRGHLCIAGVTMAKYLIPEILGGFGHLYPGIDLSLKVANRDQVIERMSANEDDLYILGHMPDYGMEVEAHPLSPNPLVVLAPKKHPLVGKKNIPLDEIAGQPFIIREPGSGVRDVILRVFATRNLQPRVRMELGSIEAIKHAIVGGLGLSVMSLHTLALDRADSPVAILDVQGFPLFRQWYVVYPKAKELSLAAKTFLQFAIENEPRMRKKLRDRWPKIVKDK